jgi:prepilin-type N-terminal cleavage/methylation domain-containing protein
MGRIYKNQGMSLIELLVAVAILLVGLIPLLSLFLQSVKTVEKSNKMVLANNLARDLSEEIRSQAFWDPEFAHLKSADYFPTMANITVPQPFGLEPAVDSFPAETFTYGDKRIEKFDDVDDYNGWCRGANCNCATSNGVCENNKPLETYDGKKYGQDPGYPPLWGFTRRVEVFNIWSNFTTAHDMGVGMKNYTTPFRFYNFQDDRLASLSTTPTLAQGRSYLKVIRVVVEYTGSVVPSFKVEDLSLAVQPVD